LHAPRAFVDENLEVTASYANTGNVPFKPRALLIVQGQKPLAMEAELVTPGTVGEARASVPLSGRQSRDLTVTLYAEGRELDSRSASVTPLVRPSFSARVEDWVLAHAFLLVGALVALVLALVIALPIVFVRRGRRGERASDIRLGLVAKLPPRNLPPRPSETTRSLTVERTPDWLRPVLAQHRAGPLGRQRISQNFEGEARGR
jgi:hypothetical protein